MRRLLVFVVACSPSGAELAAQQHMAEAEGMTVGAAREAWTISLGDTSLPTESRGNWQVAFYEGRIDIETAPFDLDTGLGDFLVDRIAEFIIQERLGPEFVLATLMSGENSDTVGNRHPVLHVACARGAGVQAFLDTEEYLGSGRAIVGMRTDYHPDEARANWEISPDGQDLFHPDPHGFVLYELLPSSELSIRLKPYRRRTRHIRFDLEGVASVVSLMSERCGLRP